MPSYTFASTANAFVLRVGFLFSWTSEAMLAIDERLIEAAILAALRPLFQSTTRV